MNRKPFVVVDDYGTVRTLTANDDGTYHGTLTVEGEPLPYSLPADVVHGWLHRGGGL